MRKWAIESASPLDWGKVKWRPWRRTKYSMNVYSLGNALKNGMYLQLEDYLGHWRLRHVDTGVTIPLDDLLEYEIKHFMVKNVHLA